VTSAARPIVLMTYNIKNPDPAHDWPARLPVVLDLIRRHDPDLLCVQEAFAHQMDDLRAGLPDHADVGQGREGGEQKKQCLCLTITYTCFKVKNKF